MTEGESQSGPRFCRQCGSVVPEGTAVCPRCGQKWYMDRTEQQGVDLWQKILEKRASAGLGDAASIQDQQQYRCPNCMAILKSPAPICPHCGKSTTKSKIVPQDIISESSPQETEENLHFSESAKGLASIKGATQRVSKLKGRKRLKRLDVLIIVAIVVIVACIAFLVARQYGFIPSLASISNTSQQPNVSIPESKPSILNIHTSDITPVSAIISWSTEAPAWGKVLYGNTEAYGKTANAEFQLDSQKVTIVGLESGIIYHFTILATDGKGEELYRSGDNIFNTPAAGDTKVPVVSNFKTIPTDVGVIVKWATDEPASSQVMYGPDQSVPNSTLVDSRLVTDHSVHITGLVPNSKYYYQIKSIDQAGNSAVMNPPETFMTLITVPIGYNVGDRASDFTLPIFKSQNSISLRDYKGQKILLTFWAVYCPECDRELSLLQSLQNKNIPGVKIVSVFLESKPEDIEKTITTYKSTQGDLTVPVVVDMYKTSAHLYNIEKVPCTFFIDSEMVIRDIEFGSFNIDQMEQTLRDL
jgi:peroxiredoxin/RNA polymerase subunit RPABC4/transcription elongation factor Spt4